MKPSFRIRANSVDVTRAIQDRLLELTITDEAGIESDRLELTLDDRRREDGAIASLPTIGTRLEVAIGYAETQIVPMGAFLVDEIEIFSPPATLKVIARAAELSGPMRAAKTRSWENMTVGEVVAKIAGEYQIEPKVDSLLAGRAIVHMDQTAESDIAFLTRLAQHHDALVKPTGGALVFVPRSRAPKEGGAVLPTITLKPSDLINWRYRHSARRPGGSGKSSGDPNSPPQATGGVKAYWWDFEKGERHEVTVGTPPYAEIRHVYPSKQKALEAASSHRQCGERAQGELELMLSGDPRIVAQTPIVIDLRPGIPTKWIVQRAEHRLGREGYTTQLACERG